jgi:hypothetical protein
VAHTGLGESRPGWGCASSVGCMRCSADAVQGAHARVSRGFTGLSGRGWPRRRAAPTCQRRGLGGTPSQATQCSWCFILRRGAARRTLALRGAAGRHGKRYGWKHTRTNEHRAQVGGCASSVACMHCSAAVGTFVITLILPSYTGGVDSWPHR